MRRSALAAALGVWLAACSGDDALSHDELIKACVARNACGIQPYARVADCVAAFYDLHSLIGLRRAYQSLYRCVVAAKGSCDGVAECFGTSRGAPRCDRSFTASCDGSRARSCDLLSGQSFVLDCSADGLGCALSQQTGFEAVCNAGACSPGDAPSCEGSRLRACTAEGLLRITDCSVRGQACQDGACLSASQESCSGGSPRCEGQVAVTCSGGRLEREDCAARSYLRRCEGGRCVQAGGDCQDELDRCEGASLLACLEGSWQSFDCGALGLAACQPARNGSACGAN